MTNGKHLSNAFRLAGLCLSVGVTAGCGAAPDQSEPTGTEQERLYKTVEVTRGPDGQPVRREFVQTKAQRDAEWNARAVRRAQIHSRDGRAPIAESAQALTPAAIAPDWSCIDFNALWVWPEADQEGTRCCISGTGDAQLSSLCTITRARSFYPGVYAGILGIVNGCWEGGWGSWGEQRNVVECLNPAPDHVWTWQE